jgi:glycosyltransferase involved in cell wall biosynthesis
MRSDEIRDVAQAHPWSPGTPLRLVTVSRLDPGKNVGATIEAVAKLRAGGHDVRFTVVGDGSLAGEWKALAAARGIADAVQFAGRVDHQQVLETLSRNHVFVFPTNVAEGFPKALHEAMACGLAVIAPRVSVIPELLRSGGGVLLDDTSPATVERVLHDLIAHPDELPRMAAAARSTSMAFTLERWRDIIADRCERAWGARTRTR